MSSAEPSITVGVDDFMLFSHSPTPAPRDWEIHDFKFSVGVAVYRRSRNYADIWNESHDHAKVKFNYSQNGCKSWELHTYRVSDRAPDVVC